MRAAFGKNEFPIAEQDAGDLVAGPGDVADARPAAREIDAWLRALMTPIETQVKEHQAQLRRRIESVQRVMEASESLDSKLAELEESRTRIDQQLAILREMIGQVGRVMDQHVTATRAPELA